MVNPLNHKATTTTRIARPAIACSAISILICVLALAPFLNSAFAIDDLTFLLQAKHALIDPLHPTAFNMVFEGERIRLSKQLVTGPVMAYLLLPVVIAGGSEWLAHAMQVLLLALASFVTAALALRLGFDRIQAAVASLLVVVSAPVLALASTAMPDVPAMAFAVVGVERVVAWRQKGNPWLAIAASLFLALAALSRPQLVLLIPIVAFWFPGTTDQRPRRSYFSHALSSNWPFLLSLVGVGVTVIVTRDPQFGDSIAKASIARSSESHFAFNLASFALHWTVAFPLGILWPVVRGKKFLNPRRSIVAFAVGLSISFLGDFLRFGTFTSALSILLICHGCDVLADVCVNAWQTKDRSQFALTAWLLIGAATAFYVHLPSKVLIPSVPAMALLLANQLNSRQRTVLRVSVVGSVAVASLALGVAITSANAKLAAIGKDAGMLASTFVQHGYRVWSDGGWGFQWYAMQAGATPLAETKPFPATGDVVIASMTRRLVDTSYPKKILVDRRVFREPGGRLFREGAGFYENTVGPWPWVWGHRELGRIEIWRISSGPGSDQ